MPFVIVSSNRACEDEFVPRLKQYSAQSGYVYQYYFDSQAETPDYTTYRFQVSANRSTWSLVEMRIPTALLPEAAAWKPQERYALAKLLLFDTFDTCAAPADLAPGADLTERHLIEFLEALGWENGH